MRRLRWVGLVSSLLIGGFIVAPVHSEAGVTTMTISVNDGAASPVTLTASACPSTAYNECYALALTPVNGVTIASAAGSIAKVLIADNTGAGSTSDLFTLSGVKFTPPLNSTVRVVYSHAFTNAPNTVGVYSFAMRIGGYFQASDATNVGDFLKLSGVGNFGAANSAVALSPDLSLSVGGPASTATSFTLTQVPTYPAVSCDTGGSCSPTITQTLTFVVTGTDSLVLTNSADGSGGGCKHMGEVDDDDRGKPDVADQQSANCKKRTKRTESFFSKQTNADVAAASAAGASPFEQCPTFEGQLCTPDPDLIQPGTITINKSIGSCDGACIHQSFVFMIEGPTNRRVIVATDDLGAGSSTEAGLIPGHYSVSEIARYNWSLQSNSCDDGVTVSSGGTITCAFVDRYCPPPPVVY